MANPAAAAPAGPQACEISHSAGGDSSKCSSSTCSSKPWGGAPEKWRRHGPMPLPTRAALAALSAALVGALLLHALALFLPPVGAEADALLPVRMQLQGAVLSGTSGAGAEQAPTNVSLVASPPPLRQQPPAVNERVQEARRQLLHMQQHVARQGPAASFWPTGCRWRLAAPTADDVAASGLCDPARVPERGRMFGGGFPDVWRCSAHTWSSSGEQWAAEQPAACRLDAVPLPAWAADRAAIGGSASLSWGTAARLPTWALEEWWARQAAAPQSAAGRQQHGGSSSSVDSGASGRAAASLPEVSTDVRCATGYCVFRGLWYSGGRFYILADPSSPQASLSKEWQLTRNRQGGVLHVASAAAFAASVRERARVVPGETTVVDSPFWMHGGAIGHTLEALLPLFSTLRHEPLVRRTPDRLLLLFQQRASLGDWARGLLAAALGVLPGQDLPPLVFQQQVANPLQQPESLLEGVGPDEWLMFEQVLWPRDLFFGGARTARDQLDARLLRALVWAQHGIEPPPPGPAHVPRVALLLRKSANRRLLNEEAVVAALREELGEGWEVRTAEWGANSTFAEQVAAMAGTGLLISAHTSALANAVFLPPGAAVLEVLPHAWGWAQIDEFFKSLTHQLGDVHHYALRTAPPPRGTRHLNPALGRLFGGWPAEACFSTECVEAQTLVDLHVDTAALRALLASRLPLLRGGARVAEAALPWPSIAVGDAAPRQRQPVGRLFGTRPQAPLPAADAVWAPVEQALPCWA